MASVQKTGMRMGSISFVKVTKPFSITSIPPCADGRDSALIPIAHEDHVEQQQHKK